MRVRIKKWRKNQGIILSKERVKLLNAHIGDSLNAAFENGNFIIKNHKTLEERIAESGVPLTFGEEIDWGESRGTELW